MLKISESILRTKSFKTNDSSKQEKEILQVVQIVSLLKTTCRLKKWQRLYLLLRRQQSRNLKRSCRKREKKRRKRRNLNKTSCRKRSLKIVQLGQWILQDKSLLQNNQLTSPKTKKMERRSQKWKTRLLKQTEATSWRSKHTNKQRPRPN